MNRFACFTAKRGFNQPSVFFGQKNRGMHQKTYIYIFIHCKYANIPKYDMLWHLPRRIYLPQTRDFSNRNWMTWGYPDTVEQSSMSGRWFTSWSFVSLTPSISGVGERWDSSLIFGQDCPWRFGDVLTFKLSMQAKWLGHGTWQGSLIPHIV